MRQSWLDASTTEDEIQQTPLAVTKLIDGNVRGAACEILTWKRLDGLIVKGTNLIRLISVDRVLDMY